MAAMAAQMRNGRQIGRNQLVPVRRRRHWSSHSRGEGLARSSRRSNKGQDAGNEEQQSQALRAKIRPTDDCQSNDPEDRPPDDADEPDRADHRERHDRHADQENEEQLSNLHLDLSRAPSGYLLFSFAEPGHAIISPESGDTKSASFLNGCILPEGISAAPVSDGLCAGAHSPAPSFVWNGRLEPTESLSFRNEAL